MKNTKKFLIVLVAAVLGLSFTACKSKKKTTKKTTDSKPTSGTKTNTKTNTSKKQTTEAKPSFDPEVAMDNFLENIDDLNYTTSSDRLTTNVYSENLITLDYSDIYSVDRAIMTVDGEVFEGKITETGLEDVIFFKYGNSLDAATEQYRTLGIIPIISRGNIWDIFTNIGDTGEYVTNSEEIKYMLAMIADYPKDFTGAMSQVSLKLDKTDPSKASFDATSTITLPLFITLLNS
jgi:hypothetical protein